MTVGTKARQVNALISRFNGLNNELERIETVKFIDTIYPDIRVRYSGRYGLVTFYRKDKVHSLPKMLDHASNFVVAIEGDDVGEVLKNREGTAVTAHELGKALGVSISLPVSDRTERLSVIRERLDLIFKPV